MTGILAAICTTHHSVRSFSRSHRPLTPPQTVEGCSSSSPSACDIHSFTRAFQVKAFTCLSLSRITALIVASVASPGCLFLSCFFCSSAAPDDPAEASIKLRTRLIAASTTLHPEGRDQKLELTMRSAFFKGKCRNSANGRHLHF